MRISTGEGRSFGTLALLLARTSPMLFGGAENLAESPKLVDSLGCHKTSPNLPFVALSSLVS